MKEKPILFSTPMVQAILAGRKTQTRRVIMPQPCKEATRFERFIHTDDVGWEARFCNNGTNGVCDRKFHIDKGDILWVRETFCPDYFDGYSPAYKANYDKDKIGDVVPEPKWISSIHMPRAAARIFLRVTGVRAERVRNISEADAIAEGICRIFDHLSPEEYEEWNSRRMAYSDTPDAGRQNEQYYKNYLWHGHFGSRGMGNKQSDAWPYQYSGYESAIGSYSSLWELLNAKRGYPWESNPWVWVYEFEGVENYAG